MERFIILSVTAGIAEPDGMPLVPSTVVVTMRLPMMPVFVNQVI